MGGNEKLHLEREWHESDDFARDANSLIVNVYASNVFQEAEEYHLAALRNVHGKHILDYGCGTGGTTVHLLAQGARVTGFDIAHGRLRDAQSLVDSRFNAAPSAFLQSAAEQLPFDDRTFDAVIGKQILHHLDLDIAVQEIARVLRPGGLAVFLEPLIHNPILEGYRRLTPHLRSPTERALSMQDIDRIGSYFGHYSHREFILLSVLPALLASVSRQQTILDAASRRLRSVDRFLIEAVPSIGRYCWETVIVFRR